MCEENYDNIELRSEEVQEIMGYVPHWVVRSGIATVFAVLLLLLTGSCFFKYPDVIESTVLITTANPPAKVVAAISEKIEEIKVKNEEIVKEGDVLAVLRSSAAASDMLTLKSELGDFRKGFVKDRNTELSFKNYTLGDLQSRYENLIIAINDYKDFMDLDYYGNKIAGAKERLKQYRSKTDVVVEQVKLKKRELTLGERHFKRAEDLYRKGILSKEAYDDAEGRWLAVQNSYESAKGLEADTHIQVQNLKESIGELELKQLGDRRKYEYKVKESVDILRSSISNWELKYLLVAPVSGRVAFSEFWSVNHNVKAGATVMTVIPEGTNKKIIGKVVLPLQRSGKVKEGQRVNIKVHNYPHMEYGMLKGVVQKVALIPSDDSYVVDVSLPERLKTNYGKKLKFIEEMRGQAEIITEDMRLIERFINPIISLFKKSS